MSASLHQKADPDPVGYCENLLIAITFMLILFTKFSISYTYIL